MMLNSGSAVDMPGCAAPRPRASTETRAMFAAGAALPFVGLFMIIAAAGAEGATLPAFPGAEGFGATAIGGRGGRVIKVTNLNPSGPGSLQAAAAVEGPRIVVFEVSGVIRGDVAIRHPRITIAGQTAPSPGITIEGRLLSRPQPWARLHDIVVRFVRIRPPPSTGHDGDAVQLPDTERVILDHVSLSWASDEIVDIIHGSEFTLQWSTVEESDVAGHGKGVPHNFGLISAYPGSGNISIHHNLFAHQSRRSPSLTPYVPGKPGDFRNNVIYNFRDALTHDGHVPGEAVNLVGNFYKRGPSSPTIAPFVFDARGRYYLHDNVVDGVGTVEPLLERPSRAPGWLKLRGGGVRLAEPADVAPVTTQPAEDAMRRVLRDAGCLPRDRVTRRTAREVIEGSGRWGRNGPSAPTDEWYLAGMASGPPRPDTDGDGIPDEWEARHGLDPRNPNDSHQAMPGGYPAIESYINERAQYLVATTSMDPHGELAVIGASYAASWPLAEVGAMRVVNVGVAGDRTAGMLRRFDPDVVARRPTAVVIWGFINDIHAAGPERIAAAVAELRANIEAMVALAQANDVTPILATELTIRHKAGIRDSLLAWTSKLLGKSSYQSYVNGHVLATNQWLRDYAEGNGILLLDFEKVLADEDGIRGQEFTAADGSHISPAGYAALTRLTALVVASFAPDLAPMPAKVIAR